MIKGMSRNQRDQSAISLNENLGIELPYCLNNLANLSIPRLRAGTVDSIDWIYDLVFQNGYQGLGAIAHEIKPIRDLLYHPLYSLTSDGTISLLQIHRLMWKHNPHLKGLDIKDRRAALYVMNVFYSDYLNHTLLFPPSDNLKLLNESALQEHEDLAMRFTKLHLIFGASIDGEAHFLNSLARRGKPYLYEILSQYYFSDVHLPPTNRLIFEQQVAEFNTTIKIEGVAISVLDYLLFLALKAKKSPPPFELSLQNWKAAKEWCLRSENPEIRCQIEILDILRSGKVLSPTRHYVTQTQLLERKDPEREIREAFAREPDPKSLKDGVTVIGYPHVAMGLGEDCRTATMSLLKQTRDLSVFSLEEFELGLAVKTDLSIADFVTPSPERKINLFTTTLFSVANAHLFYKQSLFGQRYNIGYSAWEFSDWPSKYKFCFDQLDEIWAISKFSQQCYLKYFKNVHHMPLAINCSSNSTKKRADFGLPDDLYLFLSNFDFNSGIHRKNPYAAVEAFIKAFPGRSHVGLVLKTMHSNPEAPEWKDLLRMTQQHPNIFIINEILSRDDLYALMNTCDSYVSLHRCEGFGRTLAEAMLLKKAVIATGYSGNLDFTREDTAFLVDFDLIDIREGEYLYTEPGFKWADVKLDSAVEQMRRVYRDDQSVRNIVAHGYKLISEEFNEDVLGRKYLQRINEINKNLG